MQKDSHPKSKVVKFIMPNGEILETISTYKGDEFHCERSIHDHPAWKKTAVVSDLNTKSEQVTKFMGKFGGFDAMFGQKK